jgi:hypothetical protein
MRNSVQIILLSVFVLFIDACNGGKDNTPYYKISDGFKQYCFFREQSRWIYQNDSTGTTYGLEVSDINSYIGFHSPDQIAGAYSFDIIDMVLDSTAQPTGPNISKGSITAGNPTTGSGDMNDEYWLYFKNGNFLLAFAPGFPMGVEQRLGNGPGYYTNIELLKNFELNGKDYSDVYHSQVRKTENTPDTVTYQFYIAKHYGIIKWTRRVKDEMASYSLKNSDLKQ